MIRTICTSVCGVMILAAALIPVLILVADKI